LGLRSAVVHAPAIGSHGLYWPCQPSRSSHQPCGFQGLMKENEEVGKGKTSSHLVTVHKHSDDA
jgi:hypothetical protein